MGSEELSSVRRFNLLRLKPFLQKYSIEISVFVKLASCEEDDFIIRKRKKPKRDKHEGLKLILKKTSATSTPERPFETPSSNFTFVDSQEDNFNSTSSSVYYDTFSRTHKKSKKKKKKKEKDYEKRDKKKKHRKDKKKRKDSSLEDIQDTEIENADFGRGLNVGNSNFNFILLDEDKTENSQDANGCIGPKKIEKTALQRLLESIHSLIEKKDTQQFFAWPVTDQIAPGYSLVISHPMDMNTMKRNIENNVYSTLSQYTEDLQLMCRNAMEYNRPDTIYFKAAKKLLHAGLKMTNVDKLRATPQLLPLLSQISAEELGCGENSSTAQSEDDEMKSRSCIVTNVQSQSIKLEPIDDANVDKQLKLSQDMNDSKDDDQLAEDILAQAKSAAQRAAEKVAQKKIPTEMGFLRQKKDGTTTLAIIVPNDGIDAKTRERPVLLGSLIGRLNHGSGSLQGFREDKRNFVKTVKPLYYGAFGSYAPSYDSTFANLTKEESQLLFQTYGDETAVQYAESVLNFSKDCDYVTTMVDNLLDIMTGGDHRKTKKLLEEKKKIQEDEELEEERLKSFIENKKVPITVGVVNGTSHAASGVKSATVSPVNTNRSFNFEELPKIELNQLKSLSEFGIDTSFIEYYESQQKEEQKINEKLEQTRSLLERLQQTQYERLSGPLPPHLSNIQAASENEHHLADKVTESLTNIIKKLPPGNVAPVAGVRKAMGIAPVPPQQQQPQPEPQQHQQISNVFSTQQFPNNTFQVPHVDESNCTASSRSSYVLNQNVPLTQKITSDEETLTSANTNLPTAVTGFDFESELREFLENDTALSSFQLPDDADDTDKTIEQMLSAHS